MTLVKRTYALPSETITEFEQTVPPGGRSGRVAELIRDWLSERGRERLRAEVIEGCRAMSDVYRDVEAEFHPLEEEVERGIDREPQEG